MNSPLRRISWIAGLVWLLLTSFEAPAQIIDHTSIPSVASLPQTTIDRIATLRWYFIHASVGDNIMRGLRDLRTSNPIRYPLEVVTLETNPVPPAPTLPGRVYENHFSRTKMTEFQAMGNSNGWRHPAVEVSLMKFCYLDGLATAQPPAVELARQYVQMMGSLEQAHPNTVFVYVSMPLIIYREEGDPRRDPNYLASLVNISRFNDWLRAYCQTNSKLLFDIADIESHDPSGQQTTFTWTNRVSYPAVYPAYIYDTNNAPGANSGHLIALGREQVALGWYALAAAIVSKQPTPPPMHLVYDGRAFHLSWTPSGSVLQQSTNLADPAAWQDLAGPGATYAIITNDFGRARFFRLRY